MVGPKFYIEGLRFATIIWTVGYATTLPLEVFTQKNFVGDFIRLKLDFILENGKCFLKIESLFGDLGVMYTLHLHRVSKNCAKLFLP